MQGVWPLRPDDEVDGADRLTVWQRARMLAKNCPQVALAVINMVMFTGRLTPMPVTTDEEWNELASAAFKARVKEAGLFDIAGRVNYNQALAHIERRAIIDGDVAMVPTFAPDGGAAFAFYSAPQITGGADGTGVECDGHGRALKYFLKGKDGKSVALPASQVILYQHAPAPDRVRGESELMPALKHAQDINTMVGYSKAGIKLANSMGLVSTMKDNDAAPGFGTRVGKAKDAGAASGAPTMMQTNLGSGMNIVTLPPGRDLKTVQDGRPSPEQQQFYKFLVCCIAQSVGVDPEVLFYTRDMGSAATRLVLEKVKQWQRARLDDLEPVCHRIYCHVIACEIKAGRLRPCKDKAWSNVRWIPSRDMTIDKSRQASSQINLSRELMADDDEWLLATHGCTVKQLARRRAANVAYVKAVASEYGLSMQELVPGSVGSTNVPSGDVDEPQPLPDEDPEEVKNDSE